MRFTSLAVELIRARPLLVTTLTALTLALVWFVVPILFYSSPPAGMAEIVTAGHAHLGRWTEPPLAAWLADFAFAAAGGHLWAVYLLAQIAHVVTLCGVFLLGRMMVGAEQGALAVVLTAPLAALGIAGVAFGTDVLAQPLWVLTLLAAYRAVAGEARRALIGVALGGGLLVLTTPAAPVLLGVLLAYLVATVEGRAMLFRRPGFAAALVAIAVVLPYLVAAARAGLAVDATAVPVSLRQSAIGIFLALAGLLMLVVANSRLVESARADHPAIARRVMLTPFARNLLLTVALVPAPLAIALAKLTAIAAFAADMGVLLLPIPLAVVALAGESIAIRRQHALRSLWTAVVFVPAALTVLITLLQPWLSPVPLPTSLPADAIGRFFTDAFERRTGRALSWVGGEADLARLVALAASGRPRVIGAADATGGPAAIATADTGGVVVWRATDTRGAPPPALAAQFPGLSPEVPRVFARLIEGRQPPLRIGWAIIRPAAPALPEAAPRLSEPGAPPR